MTNRILIGTGALIAFLTATMVYATVTSAEKDGTTRSPKSIGPFASQSFQFSFVGKKKAVAECVGNSKKVFLGIYVYDSFGNCVAWNDLAATRANDAGDDVPEPIRVEWYPPESGKYIITVINFAGSEADGYKLSVK